MIRYIPFVTPLVILLLVIPSLTGCGGGSSSPPPPDFPNLAGAFKFVGCCSVICALLWAVAIIHNANSRKGGR